MADKITVGLVNASSAISYDQVAQLLSALQIQVTRDLAPIWSLPPVELIMVDGPKVPPGAWGMAFLDYSDQADALGYHDLTGEGLPLGKVFVASDIAAGEDWGITASHELCEMLCDPWLNAMASVEFRGKPVTTIKEVCDAVEADALGYTIDGRWVSDFVTPAFFNTSAPYDASTRFDFCGHITAPMTIDRGGYLSVKEAGAGSWQQVFGELVQERKRALPPGTRRAHFYADRHTWRRSTAI